MLAFRVQFIKAPRTLNATRPSYVGFPQSGGTFFPVPKKMVTFWSLYWGPLILDKLFGPLWGKVWALGAKIGDAIVWVLEH